MYTFEARERFSELVLYEIALAVRIQKVKVNSYLQGVPNLINLKK